MVIGGGVKIRLVDGSLAAAQSLKQATVISESGVEMGSVLGKLPALSFELEVARD